MKKDKDTISHVRKNVPPGLKNNPGEGHGSSGRPSHGPSALRNETKVSDDEIQTEIDRVKGSIRREFPDRDIDFDQNESAYEAVQYFTYIRAAYLDRNEEGPSSISHARRYRYDNKQLRYWRDQMIRALNNV